VVGTTDGKQPLCFSDGVVVDFANSLAEPEYLCCLFFFWL
jgi:hypothetical protein